MGPMSTDDAAAGRESYENLMLNTKVERARQIAPGHEGTTRA